jgi:hypothetical protein
MARPELFLQLQPRDELTWPLNKKPQHPDWLGLDVKANSMLVDFAGFEIGSEGPEGVDGMGIGPINHSNPALLPDGMDWPDTNTPLADQQ